MRWQRMMTWMLAGGVLLLVAAGVAIWTVNNVEQAAYRIASVDGAIEIRDYPAQIVAEVSRTGARVDAVSAGFGPLAAYIFARERGGGTIPMTAPVTQRREPIAMTAPVTQTPAATPPAGSGAADAWVVRFVMPAKFTLESLPRPAGSEVALRTLPAIRRAAIRFSGVATDQSIAEADARLRQWLSGKGLRVSGPPTYAYYNAPFTPGPLRRNEIWLDLEAAPGA